MAREGTRVRIFSTSYCGWCKRAEELLTRIGIPFDVIDVTRDQTARTRLVEESGGRRTVPVIFIDEKPIGGYQELARMAAQGGLEHLKTGGGAAANALPVNPGGDSGW